MEENKIVAQQSLNRLFGSKSSTWLDTVNYNSRLSVRRVILEEFCNTTFNAINTKDLNSVLTYLDLLNPENV